MIVTLNLTGKMKSGKNSVVVTRSGQRFPSKPFVEWRASMLSQIKAQFQAEPIAVPCAVQVRYTPGDRIRRDVPGIMDAICHVLERSGVVADDYFCQDWGWVSLPMDRKEPGLSLSISKK